MVAAGAPISPLFYSGPNGGTGAYSYFDDSYSGSGSTATPYSALSGGLGDLTDGITTLQNWNTNPGPYVGWLQSQFTTNGVPCSPPDTGGSSPFPQNYCHPALGTSPSFLFDFSSTPGGVKANTLGIHLDDSNGSGAVRPPLRVEVNNGTFPVLSFNINASTIDPKWYYLDISLLPANTQFRVTLFYRDVWIMVDEIMFDDTLLNDPQVPDEVFTPEPATFVLSGAGLAAVALLRRRRA